MTMQVDSMEQHQPSGARRAVLIATSFYKAEGLVRPLIESLIGAADDLRNCNARVAFFNDSPGYAPLQSALADQLACIGKAFPWSLTENPVNLGFVRTMNLAVAEANANGQDLLLLNSDTRLEPGALPEMVRIAAADFMVGFVNPRSNNATIATLPIQDRVAVSDEQAYLAAARNFAKLLPPISFIPTAVGFCMLIRWHILAEFGGFDEIYGAGYNEENDLVMRAARCGYRAVFANRAFVWHEGEASFSTAPSSRDHLEPKNRAILDARYPFYGQYTGAFYDSPERLAERLVAQLVPDQDGRLDFAFDFSSFRADFNGTFQAGRQLLRVADEVWGTRFRTFVVCAQDVYDFHNYAELGIPRSDPHSGRAFAVVFRIGQPYDWNSIERLATSGAVVGLYMLDTISIDCPQLHSPALEHLWQFALDQADFVATQSQHTQQQLTAKFRLPPHAKQIMSRHSLDLRDYALPEVPADKPHLSGRIMVVGNHFAHKYVAPTANALAATFPGREILVLGLEVSEDRTGPDDLRPAPNLLAHRSGTLAQPEIDAFYRTAGVIVFPSHAEGFGFPVLTALAAHKPIFLRRIPVFEELWQAFGQTPNMHFYDTTAELIILLEDAHAWVGEDLQSPKNAGAIGSAETTIAGIDRALQRASFRRIAARLRAVQTAGLIGSQSRPPAAWEPPPEAAARMLGERVERVAKRLLKNQVIFKTARTAARLARRLKR